MSGISILTVSCVRAGQRHGSPASLAKATDVIGACRGDGAGLCVRGKAGGCWRGAGAGDVAMRGAAGLGAGLGGGASGLMGTQPGFKPFLAASWVSLKSHAKQIITPSNMPERTLKKVSMCDAKNVEMWKMGSRKIIFAEKFQRFCLFSRDFVRIHFL
jgi:hypothetical protein